MLLCTVNCVHVDIASFKLVKYLMEHQVQDSPILTMRISGDRRVEDVKERQSIALLHYFHQIANMLVQVDVNMLLINKQFISSLQIFSHHWRR